MTEELRALRANPPRHHLGDIVPSPSCPRGDFPVVFKAKDHRQWKSVIKNVPGMLSERGSPYLNTDWHHRTMGLALGLEQVAGPTKLVKPTLYPERLQATPLWKAVQTPPYREWQPEAINWQMMMDHSITAYAMRSGKTAFTLATAIVRGAKHITIACPGYLKPTWTREVRTWLPDCKIVVLDGRSGGRAWVCDPYRPRTERRWVDDVAELVYEATNTTEESGRIAVIFNYEILNTQNRRTGTGELKFIGTLLGMGPTLEIVATDVLIMDETQEIAGHLAGRGKNFTRGDILAMCYGKQSQAKMAMALSATPLGSGSPLKVWQVYRILAGQDKTGVLWGSTHWKFAKRYCNAQHVANTSGYGPAMVWDESGFSRKEEYKMVWGSMIKIKTAEELSEHMPSMSRQVYPIDPGSKKWKVPRGVTAKGAKAQELMLAAGRYKVTAALPEILSVLKTGIKIQVLCRHKEVASLMHETLTRACERDKELKTWRVWKLTGDESGDLRTTYAEKFKSWSGAAAVVCTMDAVRGGLSLGGVREVHTIEMHPRADVWDPSQRKGPRGRQGKLGRDHLRGRRELRRTHGGGDPACPRADCRMCRSRRMRGTS